ncbi:hypothetical protein T484DRAFT_1814490 [Baffinella frigidus]|nr:hypothetical protein T484DRAFT_1814490 [Cryptophyta sp. CCMP2293]
MRTNTRCEDAACAEADRLNTNEQIVVENPAAGVYQVWVMGSSVVYHDDEDNVPTQAYALAITGPGLEAAYALAITGPGLEAISASDSQCPPGCPAGCSGARGTCPDAAFDSYLENTLAARQTAAARGRCPAGCSGERGTCTDAATGACTCTPPYQGFGCTSVRECPGGAGPGACSGHGTCVDCSEYQCEPGVVEKITLAAGKSETVQACAGSDARYQANAACAWEITLPEGGSVGLQITHLEIESVNYFIPVLPGCNGTVECDDACDWDGLHLIYDSGFKGCNGTVECEDECDWDGLHLIRGPLPIDASDFLSSDSYGQPCHDWAKEQPGYFGTLCGDLWWLTDSPSLNFSSAPAPEALPGGPPQAPPVAGSLAATAPPAAGSLAATGSNVLSLGSNVLSLVFCSDDSTNYAGFTGKVTAQDCLGGCGPGACVQHECECPQGFSGESCQHEVVTCTLGAFGTDHSKRCPSSDFECIGPDGRVGRGSTEGVCVCAPGRSGEKCERDVCEGTVRLDWNRGELRDHFNRSQ